MNIEMRKYLAFLCLAVFPLNAQQPPVAREIVEVTLIEIPVHVVGRDGNPIRGLTREQFEILDDGKRREMTHFEVIDLKHAEPDAAAPIHPAARRNFLLLFDLSNSDATSLLRSREAARQFVLERLDEQDLAAVATYSVENGFRIAASFTLDRNFLARAVDAIGLPKFFQSSDPLLISAGSATKNESGSDEGSTGGADRETAFREMVEQLTAISRKNDDDYRRGRVRQQLRNFGMLARLLDTLQGKKQVILLSGGFDARLLLGRESAGASEAMRDMDAVTSGEIWNVDNETRFGSTSTTNTLSEMGQIFKRSDVVIHTIDIKGLRGATDLQTGLSGPSRQSNESLFLLANETGGQFFKNANDLSENFEKMLRQQEVIYVLGFQSPSRSPGKFHNLKIRVRDIPAGARAFHRAGYYEPRSTLAPLERTLSLVEILMNDIPQDDVPINLLAAPFPTAEGNPQVPVVLEASGPALTAAASGSSASGELFVYAFDRQNVVRDFLHQKISLDLSKAGSALSQRGLKFYGTLNLPPGNYVIRALLHMAGSERTGFDRQQIQVPSFKEPVVLQPLFLQDPEPWLMVKAAPRRAAEVDYPFTVGGESFVPAVEPRLSAGETYKVALFTYSIPADALQLTATVESNAGTVPVKISLAGRTAADRFGRIGYLLNFSPGKMPSGKYALNLTVRQKDSSVSHRVSAPFAVP